MFRKSWKYLLIVVLVMVACSVATPQANAWFGRCCGWGWGYGSPWALVGGYGCGYGCYSGCSSCYTGCCGTYLASDWYLAGSAACCRPRCGWGCGYGCGSYCGGCGGCGYSYSPCCGEAPMTEPTGGPAPTPAKKPIPEPGVVPTEPAPTPALPGPTPKSSMSSENSGVLTVWVPYDAKVTVNGIATKSTGSRRQFVSYGLQPGLSYKYVVKAEVVRDGQNVVDTRTVNLTAGDITAVAFGFNLVAPEQMASR